MTENLLPFYIFCIIFWIGLGNSYGQTKQTDLDDLYAQIISLEERASPDSVKIIAEEVFTQRDQYQDFEIYSEIIKIGISNAIELEDNQQAFRYLDELLLSKEYQSDTIRRGRLFLSLASGFLHMHEYNYSMQYCGEAMKCFESAMNSSGISKVLLIMHDNAFFCQEDSSNINYLDEAKEIALESKDSSLISDVYFSVGKAFFREKDMEKAIASYMLARSYLHDEDYSADLHIAIYLHLSLTYCDSTDVACELSETILRTVESKGLFYNYSNAYLGRAYCFAMNNLIDSTRIYLDLSEHWRNKSPKVNASPGYYEQMYRVSMIIYDYNRALRYLEESALQREQISKKNKASVLGNIRAEFDYQLQKARIKELKTQNLLKTERIRRQKTISWGVGIVLMISFVSIMKIRKQYQNLGLSYKNLVIKHIEVDSLNGQLLLNQKPKQQKRSGVFIKEEGRIILALTNLLENEKIYRRPHLNLTSFAEELDTNTSYLSTIINAHFQMNFKSLVNKFRIDEARKLLVSVEGANYSIEGIANEVGFQSRSVFYMTFKKTTGLTPASYVKAYQSVRPDS